MANFVADRQSGVISSLSFRWLNTLTHARCDNPRSDGNPRLQPNFLSRRTKVLSTPNFFSEQSDLMSTFLSAAFII